MPLVPIPSDWRHRANIGRRSTLAQIDFLTLFLRAEVRVGGLSQPDTSLSRESPSEGVSTRVESRLNPPTIAVE